MAGVNKVILLGNLGKDPEVRTLEGGAKLARFSIATSESYTDRSTGEKHTQTEWHNVVVWRGLAETAEKYLKKGDKIYIEGKLRTRSYEDQQGVTKYSTEIIANNFVMLGGARNDSSPANVQATNTSEASSTNDTSTDQTTDDLPF